MTLDDWTVPGAMQSLRLSPDGKLVAGLGYASAFVIELAERRKTIIAEADKDIHLRKSLPTAVHWLANDLLAVDYSLGDAYSTDLKGRRITRLGDRFIRPLNEKGESTDWVLAYRDVQDGDIDAVNARTGERHSYKVTLPGKLAHWAFDASGALRAVTMVDTAYWSEKTKISNWYRTDENSAWQLMAEGPITTDHWIPLRVLPEPNTLAILSRQDRDTYAVFRYDTAKRQQTELMAGHPTEDIVGVIGLDQTSFERVLTAGIKTQISWFDARWAGLQAGVDAALPGRINLLEGNKRGRVLVTSYGDVDPGRWYLLDTQTAELQELGAARPRIDPLRMRPMETIQYSARDGLVVNAYLTRPLQPSPSTAPMVVLIHGGPNVRDHWGWNEEVQLLASQGYVVFQPQFRGSTGFGRKFEEAGYRQWGRAMQDDITDGVQALIAQKVADPQRICIYGASYGGYAALWGVIKTPTLYKCGVSFAGVSDLSRTVSNSLFDDSNAASRELARARIGDPTQSRASLDEVSPLLHADKVQVPLFISHGGADTRVLSSHSWDMVKALQSAGKTVEWLRFPDAGHGLAYVYDRQRFYMALLEFLQKHIGPHPEPDRSADKP